MTKIKKKIKGFSSQFLVKLHKFFINVSKFHLIRFVLILVFTVLFTYISDKTYS